MKPSLDRRSFLKTSAMFAASSVLSSRAMAISANGKLRTAHIGVGGMGSADLGSISSHALVEVFALCDVDANRLKEAASKHPGAKTFADYREMLAELGDQVDAVVVSTPDHTHAPAAMTALNAGKPVYCQKPLTHEVFEARRLREVAEAKGLPTQMGIQVHSAAPYRRAVRMIQDGVIGKVSQVHAWSNKNWGYDGGLLTNVAMPPAELSWNLWLGTADERPFVPGIFHPGQWRKLIDFGTGTLGDMGVHIFDTPYAALELTAPNWAQTSCRAPTGIGHPEQNTVQYEFPGTKHTADKLIWTWYDGQMAPPTLTDVGLPEGKNLPGQGALFIGEEGTLLLPHVSEAELYPAQKFSDYQRPDVEDGNHYHQWVDACLGNGTTSAPFSYGGPLTEALLLGVVAARFPNTRLEWNAKQMRVTNVFDANRFLRSHYRDGFEVAGL
ncbi:MAG: Gfo/Idh/MocA family oxidoreductase [Pirellulaceae bacterium]|nr:Gfo/Idh/MocA family oxidoreductase [Planctomycetales bacterium]